MCGNNTGAALWPLAGGPSPRSSREGGFLSRKLDTSRGRPGRETRGTRDSALCAGCASLRNVVLEESAFGPTAADGAGPAPACQPPHWSQRVGATVQGQERRPAANSPGNSCQGPAVSRFRLF